MTRIATCLAFGIAMAHGEAGLAIILLCTYLWHLECVWAETGDYDQ